MQLRKAQRMVAKIRLNLTSVAGGGKTKSALLIAKGICGDWSKIGVIDSENHSADLYAHLGEYNVLTLDPPFSPERYIEAIKECERAGMEVIIIDSISHEWDGEGGILREADTIGGGFNTAWKQLTPRHDAFKNAILYSSCHIITTTRRKQEYVLVEDLNKAGKTIQKPVKAGMKEIQREGWEYEVSVNLELDMNHMASASKDRTGLFMDKPPFIPSEQTGKMIAEWCATGIDALAELERAVKGLETCNTIDELTILKETLPEFITMDPTFRKAGKNRYDVLKKAAEQKEELQHRIEKISAAIDAANNPSELNKIFPDAASLPIEHKDPLWKKIKQKAQEKKWKWNDKQMAFTF